MFLDIWLTPGSQRTGRPRRSWRGSQGSSCWGSLRWLWRSRGRGWPRWWRMWRGMVIVPSSSSEWQLVPEHRALYSWICWARTTTTSGLWLWLSQNRPFYFPTMRNDDFTECEWWYRIMLFFITMQSQSRLRKPFLVWSIKVFWLDTMSYFG